MSGTDATNLVPYEALNDDLKKAQIVIGIIGLFVVAVPLIILLLGVYRTEEERRPRNGAGYEDQTVSSKSHEGSSRTEEGPGTDAHRGLKGQTVPFDRMDSGVYRTEEERRPRNGAGYEDQTVSSKSHEGVYRTEEEESPSPESEDEDQTVSSKSHEGKQAVLHENPGADSYSSTQV